MFSTIIVWLCLSPQPIQRLPRLNMQLGVRPVAVVVFACLVVAAMTDDVAGAAATSESVPSSTNADGTPSIIIEDDPSPKCTLCKNIFKSLAESTAVKLLEIRKDVRIFKRSESGRIDEEIDNGLETVCMYGRIQSEKYVFSFSHCVYMFVYWCDSFPFFPFLFFFSSPTLISFPSFPFFPGNIIPSHNVFINFTANSPDDQCVYLPHHTGAFEAYAVPQWTASTTASHHSCVHGQRIWIRSEALLTLQQA